MSISGIGKSLESTLFGSKKRFINTILTTVILFAVPITLQLTFQRQDVRQRASGVYPDGCPNNYTINGTTYSNICSNLSCGQIGRTSYPGTNADKDCQATNWQTGQPYGQFCCTQQGNSQPPPTCNTSNACQVVGQVYGSADPKGYYKCDGHCWQWIDCPNGQTFNGNTCSSSGTQVCPDGHTNECVNAQVNGSADAQGFYRCVNNCWQWQNCTGGQTFSTSVQGCVTPAASCPVLRPDPVSVSCSGNTVTCTWNSSAVPNATSWTAQILSVNNTSLATTITCSSSSPNPSCVYNPTTKTLTQTNLPNGSYKCGAGGIGASTCTTGPMGYSGVCSVQVCVATKSCAAQGKTCGTISDNGCGQSETCGPACPISGGGGGGGGTCNPTTSCATQGKTCGTFTDDCGIVRTCGGACSPQCVPTTCSLQGKTCGTFSDGCGGTLNCGTCPVATSAPTTAPTTAVTSAPSTGTANIAISVSLPGIGSESYNNNAPRVTRTVSVTLNQSGTKQKVKEATSTVTYQNGKYTGSISIPNITPGSYYVRVRLDNTQYKKNADSTIVVGASAISFSENLISGDLFNTNSIGLQEYNALVNCYNGGECLADTRTKADLNDDGSVDAKDINIVLVEFARGQINGD